MQPNTLALLTAIPLLVGLAACGENRRTSSPALPDGPTLMFDAAMIPGVDAGTPPDLGRDAGPPDLGAGLPPATINADGVLTPYPHLRFEISPPGFQILSANFTVTEDGDSRGPLFQGYLEIRNVGSTVRCGFVPEIFLGFTELLGLMDADPYYEVHGTTVFTATSKCIPPGGVGVIDPLQRGVTLEELRSADLLTVDVRPFDSEFVVYRPATTDVRITRSVSAVGDGYALGGTVTPQRTIYNFALYAYARDDRGVLFDKLRAFPGELETLPALVAHPYETEATSRPFTADLTYSGWINR